MGTQAMSSNGENQQGVTCGIHTPSGRVTRGGHNLASMNHLLLTPRELAVQQGGDRAAELKKARRRIKVNMPGYTGHIRGFASGPHWPHFSGRFGQTFCGGGTERKHSDLPFATPDNMYRHASPRIKTNGKNYSAFTLGDARDRFWETTYVGEFIPPEGSVEYKKEPLYDDWEDMEPEQRGSIYQRAFNLVGAEVTAELEQAIRTKIEQRTAVSVASRSNQPLKVTSNTQHHVAPPSSRVRMVIQTSARI